MRYDFTSHLERHGKDSIAVDGLGTGFAPEPPEEGFDVIPMWVADMNFPTVPTVTDAIIERAKHPAFGYFSATDEYYDSIIRWQETRNGVTGLAPEHIGYENGVLGGVVATLNSFVAPGDKVLLHSPTYIGFTKSLENNGLSIVHSPHNPCGRVWERWEIERAMELYRKYNCVVVSDEIWSDLILPGHRHVPTQSVSDDARRRTVALYAPSKTFNLAGLVGSYHVIYDKSLRDRVTSRSSKCHYNDMNVLSMHALVGAYRPEGYEWLDELTQVLGANVDWACDYIAEHFDGVSVQKPQGTYMLFVDCLEWCAANGRDIDWVERACWRVGVAVQDGRMFHGPCHLRMNLALPSTASRRPSAAWTATSSTPSPCEDVYL